MTNSKTTSRFVRLARMLKANFSGAALNAMGPAIATLASNTLPTHVEIVAVREAINTNLVATRKRGPGSAGRAVRLSLINRTVRRLERTARVAA